MISRASWLALGLVLGVIATYCFLQPTHRTWEYKSVYWRSNNHKDIGVLGAQRWKVARTFPIPSPDSSATGGEGWVLLKRAK